MSARTPTHELYLPREEYGVLLDLVCLETRGLESWTIASLGSTPLAKPADHIVYTLDEKKNRIVLGIFWKLHPGDFGVSGLRQNVGSPGPLTGLLSRSPPVPPTAAQF